VRGKTPAPAPPPSKKGRKGGVVSQPVPAEKKGGGSSPHVPRIRPPRSAAVTLPPGSEDWTYARVLTLAKLRVSLGQLGISVVRIKTSREGGVGSWRSPEKAVPPGLTSSRKGSAKPWRILPSVCNAQ